ncbi:unnamed protein product [Phytomonas sp. Hart1]|nr:unnamed protein product [Phytomonas sp. Hart1]|eukprot:CCW70034.1 unnamed protein product [Phytomonas sp. isolate Hart1]
MPGVKRSADFQLTSENHDDEADHEHETIPTIASEEELSKRRFLKVRRDAYSTGAEQTPSPGTGGVFKNLRPAAPDPAITGKAPFDFGGKFGSFANGPNAATTSGDAAGIGSKPAHKSPEKDCANTNVSPAPSFSFHPQTTSPGATGAGSNGSFSFSFTTAAARSDTDTAPRNELTKGNQTPQQNNSHLFGSSTFSFAGAVKSFVDARKKLEEDRKNTTEDNNTSLNTEGDDAHDEAKDHKDDDTADKFESHSIITSSGEVLASAPCKLFLFDSKNKKWLDRGESEAKVKHECYNASEATSGNVQDDNSKGNNNTADYCYRLLVRNGYSLNSLIDKNAFVLGKEGPKHILFSVSNPGGSIANYLLKFMGPNGEFNTKIFIQEIEKAMSASK